LGSWLPPLCSYTFFIYFTLILSVALGHCTLAIAPGGI
jgi:hypothetical protein